MRGRPFRVTWREKDTLEALKAAYRGGVTLSRERGCRACGFCGLDGGFARWPRRLVSIIALYSGG